MDGFKPIHKNGGIYKKNTTVCRMRQEGFGKFIEVNQEKYDTSCEHRKNWFGIGLYSCSGNGHRQVCWWKSDNDFCVKASLRLYWPCLFYQNRNPPTQRSDGFCRVNRRQNESGVLRGGKFFCGLSLTEVVGLTVITNHFLWLCSKWTRPHLVDEFEPIHKINGIYKKNTTACRMRQEGFEKFIEVKQEKYDTSCSFRKKYAMWIRTNPIFCLR